MKIIMCAAISSDGFIADNNGNGDFSSVEDKTQFRSFLRSDQVDAFIIGRKTFEEFGERILFKPTYVLSRTPGPDASGATYFDNFDELPKDLNYALLGGADCYNYFLSRGLVDEARITIENDLTFGNGLALNFEKYKSSFLTPQHQALSSSTDLLTYKQIKQNTNNRQFLCNQGRD